MPTPATPEASSPSSSATGRADADADGAAVTSLAAGALFAISGSVVGRALQLTIHVVLARLLGPAQLGLYVLGWTIVYIGRLVAVAGLDKGMIRYGAGWWQQDEKKLVGLLRQGIGFSVAAGLAASILLYLGAPYLALEILNDPDLLPVLRWFSLALPLVPLLRVAAAATRVTQRVHYAVLSEDVLQPVSNLLLIVLLLQLGWGLRGALVAFSLSFAVATVVILSQLAWLVPGLRRRSQRAVPWPELLTFSFQSSLASIFTILAMWLDRLMVGYFLGAREVGVYHAASQISMLFPIAIGSFGLIFAPLIARAAASDRADDMRELFRVNTKWGIYLTLPAFLLIAFNAREILTLVFGKPFAEASGVLVILSVGQLANAATGPVGLLLIMTGHTRDWFWCSGLMLVVSIVLNLALIPIYGTLGAALGTAAAVTMLFALGIVRAYVRLRTQPYDRRYGKIALAALAAILALALVEKLALEQPFLVVFFGVLAAFGVFFLVLSRFPLDAEERHVFDYVLRRLRNQRRLEPS